LIERKFLLNDTELRKGIAKFLLNELHRKVAALYDFKLAEDLSLGCKDQI
jgi:hypothetical protein